MHSGQLKQQDIPVMVRMNIPGMSLMTPRKQSMRERINLSPASPTGGAGGEVIT